MSESLGWSSHSIDLGKRERPRDGCEVSGRAAPFSGEATVERDVPARLFVQVLMPRRLLRMLSLGFGKDLAVILYPLN